MIKTGVIILISLWLMERSFCQKNPVELGDVHWYRDLTKAQLASKQSAKPIFILFQEIPGCSTCQRYGSQVLTHPLLVEALENEFIPLAIHNNKTGEDAKVLRMFDEPSWNNPVARIVNYDLEDISPRLDGGYSPKAVTDYMHNALKLLNKKVPGYFDLLSQYFTDRTQSITFSMFCFWEGESKLGALPGIVSTKPGFMHGREVVKVHFDPGLISPEKLMYEAKKQNCAGNIYANEKDLKQYQKIDASVHAEGSFRSDKEPQYYLLHSDYRYVPMLPGQASKVNSALAANQNPDLFLSPRQLEMKQFYSTHKSIANDKAYASDDFVNMWKEVALTIVKNIR